MPNARTVLAVLLFLLSCGAFSSGALAQEIHELRVESDGSESRITIRSRLVGYAIDDYSMRTGGGAHAVVDFQVDNPDCHFVIVDRDDADAAIFDSLDSGNHFEGDLPSSGNVGVRVYLTSNAARRGETADYTLKMNVAGAGGLSLRSGP